MVTRSLMTPVILSPPAGRHAHAVLSLPLFEDRGVTPERSSAALPVALSPWSKSYASTSTGMPWAAPGERGSGEHRPHRVKMSHGACSRLENLCSHSETKPWPVGAVLGIGRRQERVRRAVAVNNGIGMALPRLHSLLWNQIAHPDHGCYWPIQGNFRVCLRGSDPLTPCTDPLGEGIKAGQVFMR